MIKKMLLINLIIILPLFSGCSEKPELQEAAEISGFENFEDLEEDFEDFEDFEEDTEDINDENSAIKDGFAFIYNDVRVYLGEYTERVLKELGPEIDYYEMDSCSFDGTAMTYFYGSFEIETYLKTKNGRNRVYSIDFTDDGISTAEGVHIGQSYEDMVEAYGTGYNIIPEISGFYSYSKNGTLLNFNIREGVITNITYKVEDIYA